VGMGMGSSSSSGGMGSDNKRLRYESMGSSSTGPGPGPSMSSSHNHESTNVPPHQQQHHHGRNDEKMDGGNEERPISFHSSNTSMQRGSSMDRAASMDRASSMERSASMERASSSGQGHQNMDGPGPTSRAGPMGGGAPERHAPSNISPRRSFSNPGRNSFGRGRGGHPSYQPDRTMVGNDYESENQDQFGRQIPQNTNTRGGPPNAPYGRGHRSFGIGRGRGGYGRQGGGGRFQGIHQHPDRFGGRGRMGRGYNSRSSDHYNPRPGMSTDYHARHGSSFHDENNDNHQQEDTSNTQPFSSRRNVTTPPPQREEEVDVVPPSPPAAAPSGLAVALARLSDLTAQMEFQYAKHLQLTRDHEIVKTKISTLKELPVGMDAFKDDLDKLMKGDEKVASTDI
jgi:hypothetical protein